MFPWKAEEIQTVHHHDQRVHYFLCLVRNRVQKADWQLGTWPLATEHLEIPMPRSLYFPSMIGGNSACMHCPGLTLVLSILLRRRLKNHNNL